jgi:SAM-dependent methyltransferase
MKLSKQETLVEGPPLKLVDQILRRWRFSKAKPFIERGDRILDVGCSDGALFRYLGDRVAYGVGVDPALRRSVELPKYRLISGSLTEDVVLAGPFDVVTMLAVLEHLPTSVLRQLREVSYGVLRPGGRLIITVPSPRVDSILHALERLRLISGIGLDEHHGFDPSAVPNLFQEDGFRLVARHRFQMGLNHLFVFRRLGEGAGGRFPLPTDASEYPIPLQEASRIERHKQLLSAAIDDELIVLCYESFDGFPRTGPPAGENRVAVDVGVLHDEVAAFADQVAIGPHLGQHVLHRVVGIEDHHDRLVSTDPSPNLLDDRRRCR